MTAPTTHEIVLDNFHSQLRYVLDTYSPCGKSAVNYRNIIIGGLGGSGIGGRIARLVFSQISPIPVEVFSEYQLPAYASKDTLVILSSYSGNTEETLSMYAHAKQKGCEIIVLSSGGKITELALADGHKVYGSPEGYQPRMALGFSLSTLLMILGEICGTNMGAALSEAENMLKNSSVGKMKGEEMFAAFEATIFHKFVVVCDLPYEAIAIRFCQQIQENAKGESFVTVLPEANHNVIETYNSKLDTNFIFLNSGQNNRVNLRFQYLRTVLEKHGNNIFEYPQTATFDVTTMFAAIHALDWLSILSSNARKADNLSVPIIAGLKTFLDQN
ncbi:MAG: SIS domain-containing protein [Bacteroidia bacterium]|nr:SIS domain-containing protein [Bacteroidia bacterium]